MQSSDQEAEYDQTPPDAPIKSESAGRIQLANLCVKHDEYDIDSWSLILNWAAAQPIETARDTYSRYLSVFPTATPVWKECIERELQAKCFEKVEALFQQCLLKCLDIEIWMTYLKYIKLVSSDNLEKLETSFEFALKHMSYDVGAVSIFSDYIRFIGSHKVSSSYEAQKISVLRKLYQKAIVLPILNIDSLWKEYDVFENSINKELAKGLLSEYSPKYLAALSISKERWNHISTMIKGLPARPPQYCDKRTLAQLEIHHRYLEYEQSNPLHVDVLTLKNRVLFAYHQALLVFRYYPEFYYEGATFLASLNFIEDAVNLYNEGLEAMPDNVLIYFMFADFYESRKMNKEAKDIYAKALNSHPLPIIFIQNMRFIRRTEGVELARSFFLSARKNENCTYHVFIAAALLECQLNNAVDIAAKIFEFGLKKYGNEANYLLAYIEFLESQHDSKNLRVLFEKSLSTITSFEQSYPIWEKFLDFERAYGDWNSLNQVEKRRMQAASLSAKNFSPFLDLIDRYKFRNLWPCSLEYRQLLSHNVYLANQKGATQNKPWNTFISPDFSKMKEYKKDLLIPSSDRPPAYLPPYPVPEAIAELLKLLPSPEGVPSPTVPLDYVIDLIMNISTVSKRKPDAIEQPPFKHSRF